MPQPRHYWRKSGSGEGASRTVLRTPPAPKCQEISPVYSVSHVPEAVLSSRFSVLRVNRQHSAITQKNHAADERGFTQILANVDQLIRGGVLVTGRPGSPERAQTRVITGESQAQAGGLAGPFCVPPASKCQEMSPVYSVSHVPGLYPEHQGTEGGTSN